MTTTRDRGMDAPALVTADPDEVTLICRHCGQLFIGRADWEPVCIRCWRRTRGHYCTEPCPPCSCPACDCLLCQARARRASGGV
ncbi:MAG: hypothetical protein ACXVS6_22705 [Solirubrobacteraceae bacterium]